MILHDVGSDEFFEYPFGLLPDTDILFLLGADGSVTIQHRNRNQGLYQVP